MWSSVYSIYSTFSTDFVLAPFFSPSFLWFCFCMPHFCFLPSFLITINLSLSESVLLSVCLSSSLFLQIHVSLSLSLCQPLSIIISLVWFISDALRLFFIILLLTIIIILLLIITIITHYTFLCLWWQQTSACPEPASTMNPTSAASLSSRSQLFFFVLCSVSLSLIWLVCCLYVVCDCSTFTQLTKQKRGTPHTHTNFGITKMTPYTTNVL